MGSVLHPTRMSPSQFCRAKQDKLPVDREDHQARFYEVYRKVAEEYDEDFLKKYEEDLNTTLIFVSLAWDCIEFPLTRASGWSLFCSYLRIHRPGRSSDQAQLRQRDRCPPPSPDLQDRQHHFRRRHSLSPPMVWSSTRDG